MLFHDIYASNVRAGDHLYRWRMLKRFQGIAVQYNEDPSEILVVMFNGSNSFRLVKLCEFKGRGILRRALYDQGGSYVHGIKLSGTSFIEKSRPPEEIVQNARLLLDTANRNPELIQQFFINGFEDFARLCCTINHEEWRNQLLGQEVNLLSGDNLPQVSPPSVDMNKMKELENKIESLEDKQCCAICLDLTSNVAFSCGHLACSQCAQPLKQCHFCRQDIQQKIPLFFS